MYCLYISYDSKGEEFFVMSFQATPHSFQSEKPSWQGVTEGNMRAAGLGPIEGFGGEKKNKNHAFGVLNSGSNQANLKKQLPHLLTSEMGVPFLLTPFIFNLLMASLLKPCSPIHSFSFLKFNFTSVIFLWRSAFLQWSAAVELTLGVVHLWGDLLPVFFLSLEKSTAEVCWGGVGESCL